jgi:hypothetical protein
MFVAELAAATSSLVWLAGALLDVAEASSTPMRLWKHYLEKMARLPALWEALDLTWP